MSLNTVTLTGRLGGDPDVRFFESGSAVCRFSLAVDGPKENETHWILCNYWFNGSRVIDYLVKGQLVGVSGRLEQEKWTGKDGAKDSRVVVLATRIELLGRRRADANSNNANAGASQASTAEDAPNSREYDEIPL